MSRLLLVRHGEVRPDNPGRYWGHTDVPLSAEGIRQAEKLRDRLARERISAIYSSDLRRAMDTAAMIAVSHRVPSLPCAALREINFEQFEGMTFAEIERRYPGAERLWAGVDLERGFPGGESLGALIRRVDHFIKSLSKHDPTDTVLIVAHGGPLRTLVCRMIGLDPHRWWQIRIDLASLSILDSYPEGAVLCLLNDVCHLEAS